jgi:hypothetical protein
MGKFSRTTQSPASRRNFKMDSYIISADGKSITCLTCRRVSHNAADVRERYCGCCHRFHDGTDLPLPPDFPLQNPRVEIVGPSLEFRHLLEAAMYALRSYQFGNSSPELANEVANKIREYLET